MAYSSLLGFAGDVGGEPGYPVASFARLAHQCDLVHCIGWHMPALNVRTAAQLTGRDRSTITRLIEKGRLSATRDDRGYYLIDPSELERVFGSLASPDARTDAAAVHRTGLHDATQADARAREIEILREMLEGERATHERERRVWEDERGFLRGLVERQTEQLKLLTDQSPAPRRRRRWWLWLI